MSKLCNPNCFYFPKEESIEFISSYLDDNNVKHQVRNFRCCYDSHIIKEWLKCSNYKTFQEVKVIDS